MKIMKLDVYPLIGEQWDSLGKTYLVNSVAIVENREPATRYSVDKMSAARKQFCCGPSPCVLDGAENFYSIPWILW